MTPRVCSLLIEHLLHFLQDLHAVDVLETLCWPVQGWKKKRGKRKGKKKKKKEEISVGTASDPFYLNRADSTVMTQRLGVRQARYSGSIDRVCTPSSLVCRTDCILDCMPREAVSLCFVQEYRESIPDEGMFSIWSEDMIMMQNSQQIIKSQTF
eukprot:TRINITY_DN2089_c0_g1_i1.p1 TRINITY_DN2089_c0_g1~~TRINITY_DN2089_c0_g1_i1.p1  ORF type:complete len:154 (+),score=23.10 TRINITY_DN2089_c0_g1_i1:155-616(+)